MGKKFDEFSKKAVDALKKYKYAALVLVLGLALLLIPFRKSAHNCADAARDSGLRAGNGVTPYQNASANRRRGTRERHADAAKR